MITAFLLGLAIGAAAWPVVTYFVNAPAGKFTWLDAIRAKLGSKP